MPLEKMQSHNTERANDIEVVKGYVEAISKRFDIYGSAAKDLERMLKNPEFRLDKKRDDVARDVFDEIRRLRNEDPQEYKKHKALEKALLNSDLLDSREKAGVHEANIEKEHEKLQARKRVHEAKKEVKDEETESSIDRARRIWKGMIVDPWKDVTDAAKEFGKVFRLADTMKRVEKTEENIGKWFERHS